MCYMYIQGAPPTVHAHLYTYVCYMYLMRNLWSMLTYICVFVMHGIYVWRIACQLIYPVLCVLYLDSRWPVSY